MCEIVNSNFEDMFPKIEAAIVSAEFLGKNKWMGRCKMRGAGKCQRVKCGGRCGDWSRSLHARMHHGQMTTTRQATH